MKRRRISAVCLLVLAGSPAAAVPAPLLAADAPLACCTGNMCPHHRKQSAPSEKPSCHSPGKIGLEKSSLSSCNHAEQRATGPQLYLLVVPLDAARAAWLPFELLAISQLVLTPAREIDPPPPRAAFV